jgi:hypothetical protein
MSELAQAMQVASALPALQKESIERLIPLLSRLPISDVIALADAIEQKGTRTLRESLMAVRGEKVRVAEWHMVYDPEVNNERCEHKRYSVGTHSRANHGKIGDETWLEAWIA